MVGVDRVHKVCRPAIKRLVRLLDLVPVLVRVEGVEQVVDQRHDGEYELEVFLFCQFLNDVERLLVELDDAVLIRFEVGLVFLLQRRLPVEVVVRVVPLSVFLVVLRI